MDIDSMKVTELKAELKKRGLPMTGLRAELVARLENAIDEELAKEAGIGSEDVSGADSKYLSKRVIAKCPRNLFCREQRRSG